jgi:hypothetical protein
MLAAVALSFGDADCADGPENDEGFSAPFDPAASASHYRALMVPEKI